jgi:type IV pilus assembly protein PilA
MQSRIMPRLLRAAQAAAARRSTIADEEGTESGFTLIELMVVLLIMAILLAIAIPTFLGVKGGAQDRAAQSNLTNALLSAKALYTNQGTYPPAASFTATMLTQEPELLFTTTAVTTAPSNQISFATSTDGNQLILVDYSPNAKGTCWALSDNNGASTSLGSAPLGDSYAAWTIGSTAATACSAANVSGFTAAEYTAGTSWQANYPTNVTAESVP